MYNGIIYVFYNITTSLHNIIYSLTIWRLKTNPDSLEKIKNRQGQSLAYLPFIILFLGPCVMFCVHIMPSSNKSLKACPATRYVQSSRMEHVTNTYAGNIKYNRRNVLLNSCFLNKSACNKIVFLLIHIKKSWCKDWVRYTVNITKQAL